MAPRTALSTARVRVASALVLASAAALTFTGSGGRLPASRLRPLIVHSGSLNLRVVRDGRGVPVVLVHGFGESLVCWRSVFTRLAEHTDVTALDLPGHGLSSKPATGYTIDSLAAALIRTLDALHIDHAILVGHSLGGAVAAAAALHAPQRVLALILVDPAIAVTATLLPDSAGAATRASDAMRRTIAEYEAQRSRLTSVHDRGWLREADSALAYLPAADPAYRPALAALLREFDFRYLTPERARHLRLPTLLIWGQLDPLVPSDNGRRLAAELPDARLVVVPRSWHRPHVERPDVVTDLILRFLALHAASAP
jgi:pyruvate dehydrogenase E2 component (dihydrolipoamide acetyltransferase)